MWAAAPVGCGREPGPGVPAPWDFHRDAPQRVTGGARPPGLSSLAPAAVRASSLSLMRPSLMFSLDLRSTAAAGSPVFSPSLRIVFSL